MSALTLRDLAVSFHLRRRCVRVACTLLLALALSGSLACRRRAAPTRAGETVPGLPTALGFVPADAGLVLALDLGAVRAQPLGRALLAQPTEVLVQLDRWLRAVGAGGLARTRHVLAALPAERQADDRLLIVLDVDELERTTAEAWLAERKPAGVSGRIADGRLLIGRGAWAATAATSTAAGPTASELGRLCQRAARNHPAWFAAVVAPTLRARLSTEARFTDVAAVARIVGAVGIDDRLRIDVTAESSNHDDARMLEKRLASFMAEAKRHPDLLAQGLAPHLEALRVAARGPLVHASLALPAEQAIEVLARVSAILRAQWPAEPRR